MFNSAVIRVRFTGLFGRNVLSVAACLCFFFCSCASTKRLIYLQDNGTGEQAAREALLKNIRVQNFQYRLKPDDRLLLHFFSLTDEKINFLKNPELEVRVDEAGQINLPVMGAIPVGGLTLKEMEEKLKKISAEYLRSPEVFVKLLNYNITLLGEVNKQGTYNIVEPKVNILEAIGYAGGLTDNANMQNIRILRNAADSVRVFEINMLDDNTVSSYGYFLQPNDVVLVNPVKYKSKNQQRVATIGLVISILSSLAWIIAR